MNPEDILNELTENLDNALAQNAGLSKQITSILSKAIESIFNYIRYKIDPFGNQKIYTT